VIGVADAHNDVPETDNAFVGGQIIVKLTDGRILRSQRRTPGAAARAEALQRYGVLRTELLVVARVKPGAADLARSEAGSSLGLTDVKREAATPRRGVGSAAVADGGRVAAAGSPTSSAPEAQEAATVDRQRPARCATAEVAREVGRELIGAGSAAAPLVLD